MLYGIALIVLKRLWSRPGLTGLSLLSVVLAIGLATSISIFSQAVDLVILREQLNEIVAATGRPPFSLQIYSFPSPQKPLSLEDAEQLGTHIGETIASEAQLPLRQLVLQVESSAMTLQPRADDSRYSDPRTSLASVRAVFRPDVGRRMEIVAGDPLPVPPVPEGEGDGGSSEGEIEVWMHTRLASEMGLHVGETFDLVPSLEQVRLPIRVAGIWQARDVTDPLWFQTPGSAYSGEALLVRRQDYIAHIQPHLFSKTGFVSWYVVLDDRTILPQRTEIHVRGLERAIAIVNKYLPGARVGASPLLALEKFLHRETVLMTLLVGFNVPAWGFLLYFLILISAIVVRWQQAETAIMVSRGMGRSRLLTITLVEGLILCGLGYPLGVGVGMALARLMGYTLSFLSFAPRPPLPVSTHGINFALVAAAVGVSIAARLLPTLQAAKHSVVAYERAHSRPLRPPFWQRYPLDLLLAIPTTYAYRQLLQVGALGRLVRSSPADLYQDPLLILVPALFVLVASLLSMRIFPLAMQVVDWLSALLSWATPHLSFRQLSRRSGQYTHALLLVIAALSLGVYLASLASSLDQWLVDRMYYRAGADVSFRPYSGTEGEGGGEEEVWVLPISDYLTIPGVQRAARVGDYPADITITGKQSVRGRFLGIDRLDFPTVAAFRSDFAAVSLGELMNRLALQPDGILVSRRLLGEGHLWLGDQFRLRIVLGDMEWSAPFTIVGAYDYFPTVYEDRPTVIGNLEYLFSQIGGAYVHHVWLRLDLNLGRALLFEALEHRGVKALHYLDAREMIQAEQEKWERVGIFGTLSVGFLAAAAMGGIGLLVYNYASLRERLYHFAVLRAVGLTRRQLIGQVMLEYGALTLYGAGNGVLIGLLISHLFIPFFRVTGEQGMPLPPLLPIIAWDEIARLAAAFAGAMILAQAIVVTAAVRRGLFQVLRMGE